MRPSPVHTVPMRLVPGTICVVTGAAHGIGRALATQLAARGAILALADRDAAALAEVSAALSARGATVVARPIDVASRDAVHAFAARIAEQLGPAELVVANAGVGTYGTFEEVTEARFDEVLAVNLHGVIHTVRAFLPHLRRRPVGHVVTISSVFGLVAPAGQVAYATSKFGVRGFSEALRHELEGSPVRVSVVHPGGVRTAIAEHASWDAERWTEAERRERIARFLALTRTSPEDAAATILRGVEADAPRILVGPDAPVLAWLARLAPVRYWRVLRRVFDIG